MNPTPVSLLDRLRVASPDSSDWARLCDIYHPLIMAWIRRAPGLRDEAADLAQEVLLVVFRELPKFQRLRDGSFRAWLRQVTVNRVRTYVKLQRRRPVVGLDSTYAFLDDLEAPQGELAREWDREHDRFVFEKLLAIIRQDFAAATWEAFRRFAIDGQPAARVAQELKMTENAVICAKARILKKLREEAGDFL